MRGTVDLDSHVAQPLRNATQLQRQSLPNPLADELEAETHSPTEQPLP